MYDQNQTLFLFVSLVIVVAGSATYVFRATFKELMDQTRVHARTYAVAYVKCGVLMFITAAAAFDQAYAALDRQMQESMPWAPYFMFLSKPLTAAGGVVVAFLDRINSPSHKQPPTQNQP